MNVPIPSHDRVGLWETIRTLMGSVGPVAEIKLIDISVTLSTILPRLFSRFRRGKVLILLACIIFVSLKEENRLREFKDVFAEDIRASNTRLEETA